MTEIKTKTCIECTGIYNIWSYILLRSVYKRFYAQILLSIKIKPKLFFRRKLTISHWLYHRLSPLTSFLFKYLNFLGLRKILVFGVLFFGISLFWKYITGTNKRSLCVNGVGTLKKHFNQLNLLKHWITHLPCGETYIEVQVLLIILK